MSESWRKVVCDMAILRPSSYLLQEAIVKQLDIPIVQLLFFVPVTNYILGYFQIDS